MTEYTIKAPDGREITIEARDEATAIRGAQSWVSANPKSKPITKTNIGQNFMEPIAGAVRNVATKYRAMADETLAEAGRQKARASEVGGLRAAFEGATRGRKQSGPSILDLVSVAASPLAGAQNVLTKPVAQALVGMGVSPYANNSLVDQAKSMFGKGGPSYKMRGDEAVDAVNSGITAALAGAMPARGARPPTPRAPVRPARDAAIENIIRGIPPQQLQARGAEMSAAGINPRLIDVLPDQAIGRVRAAATRQTPARAEMVRAAEQARINLPERVSEQVRRNVSRTPSALEATVERLRQQRGTEATTNYGPSYQTNINPPPEALQAVRSESGRAAIDDTLRVVREDINAPASEITDLLRLRYAAEGGAGPMPAMSARVFDRVQIALRQAAENLSGYGPGANRPLAGAIGGTVINQALDQVPQLGPARAAYRQSSRVIDAVEAAPSAITPGGAENIRNLTQGLTPQQLQPARDVLAQSMIERGGESLSSARSLLDRAAYSPEMQGRIAQYTGPQSAQGLATGSRLELERLQNLQRASPRINSETATNTQDLAEGAGRVIDAGRKLARGDVLGVGIDWLRSRGISDATAQSMIETVLDPNGLSRAVDYIRAREGPGAAVRFLQERQQLIQSVPTLQIAAQNAANASLPQIFLGAAAQEDPPQ